MRSITYMTLLLVLTISLFMVFFVEGTYAEEYGCATDECRIGNSCVSTSQRNLPGSPVQCIGACEGRIHFTLTCGGSDHEYVPANCPSNSRRTGEFSGTSSNCREKVENFRCVSGAEEVYYTWHSTDPNNCHTPRDPDDPDDPDDPVLPPPYWCWEGYDKCNVCGGNNACLDCHGTPFGLAVTDFCGVCGGGVFPDGYSPQFTNLALHEKSSEYCSECPDGQSLGCDGLCSANPTEVDACGVCGGDGTTCLDCNDVPFGGSSVDACGVCGGGIFDEDLCPVCLEGESLGCDGLCSANPTEVDACGLCGGEVETKEWIGSYDTLCLGESVVQYDTCGSSKTILGSKTTGDCECAQGYDVCGVCGGGATDLVQCISCPQGFDACGVCGGEKTSITQCDWFPNLSWTFVTEEPNFCEFTCADNHYWNVSVCIAYDSCTFNGEEVLHGESILAYESDSVPAGQTCQSETRTCTDGELSGTFTYSTCEVLPQTQHQLTVTRIGDGSITSNPTGITCGSTCSSLYDEGTLVTLTASPSPNTVFTGWSGCDSEIYHICTVTMNQARSVTANLEFSETISDSSIICEASGSYDLLGDVTYEFTWYRVLPDGSLGFIQNNPVLETSQHELRNEIFVCEVIAVNEYGKQSLPERKVATLQSKRVYIPYGILVSEVEQIGDFVGVTNIPRTVRVSSSFDFVVRTDCLFGECVDVSTEFLFNPSYLSSLQNRNIVFPYFFNFEYYLAETAFIPNMLTDFQTQLSARTTAFESVPSLTNPYTIERLGEKVTQDFANLHVVTTLYFTDGTTYQTSNSSIVIQKPVSSIKQDSYLVVQDAFYLIEPFRINATSFTTFSPSPLLSAVEGSANQFLPPPSRGEFFITAHVNPAATSSEYLEDLLLDVSSVQTRFFLAGETCDLTLEAIPLTFSVSDVTSSFRKHLSVQLIRGDGSIEDLSPRLGSISLSFNGTELANHSLEGFSSLFALEQEVSSCTTCKTGFLKSSASFSENSLRNLFSEPQTQFSPITVSYNHPSCGTYQTNIPVTVNYPEVWNVSILSPKNRFVYYNDTTIDLLFTTNIPSEEITNVKWQVLEDGTVLTGSQASSFTYTFTNPGQSVFVLQVTTRSGHVYEDASVVLISASPAMLSYVDSPSFNEILFSDDGYIQFNASGSYAVESTIDSSCDTPQVRCVAGNCPSETGNSPLICGGSPLAIIDYPQPYSDITFDWAFADDFSEQVIGSPLLTRLFNQEGRTYLNLTLSLDFDGIPLQSYLTNWPFEVRLSEPCSYSLQTTSRTHYTKFDNANYGSVVLNRSCGSQGYSIVPDHQITFVSSNPLVATQSGQKGIYRVDSAGEANLSIYHNGINTGQVFRVRGVCGIDGIVLTEPLTKDDEALRRFEIKYITGLKTIPNPNCGELCNRDISNNVSYLTIQKISQEEVFNIISNTYKGINVTYCGIDNTQAAIRISYDASEFFCGEKVLPQATFNLYPQTVRQTACSLADNTEGVLKNMVASYFNSLENELGDEFISNLHRFNIILESISHVLQNRTVVEDIIQSIEAPRLLRFGSLYNELNQQTMINQELIQDSCREAIKSISEKYINFIFNNFTDVVCAETITQITQARGAYIKNEKFEFCAVEIDELDRACCDSTKLNCVFGGDCYNQSAQIIVDETLGTTAVCVADD